ncbi:MAG: tetratricopeptide repeat protein [Bacteroidetes bacterium]|nr:tetratricopeptide repeat protein [Bacteroidota bacterium]MBL7105184.1 tetratricopeptide repeat protein [Bacteroidales bacterium]
MKKIIVLIISVIALSGCNQTSEEYFKMGLAKDKIGDYKGAILDYNKAIELYPEDKYAYNNYVYNNRGVCKYELGDYRGAILDCNKAIELDPEFMYAYYNRGLCKYELGDIDGACLDFSKAGELGNMDAYNVIKEYCN